MPHSILFALRRIGVRTRDACIFPGNRQRNLLGIRASMVRIVSIVLANKLLL